MGREEKWSFYYEKLTGGKMSSTYDSMMRKQYDNLYCSSLFKQLLEKPKDSDLISKIIEASLPVLACVLNTNFKRIKPGSEEYDEIVSSVPVSFYLYLTNDKFYTKYYHSEESHFSFLFGIFRYEVLNVLKRVRRFQKNEFDLPSAPTLAINLSSSYAAMEHKIILRELPQYLYDEVKSRLRFSDEENLICDTIASCLILDNRIGSTNLVPVATLTQVYDIEMSRIEFFVNFVKTIVYMKLFDYKQYVDTIPSVMDVSLTNADFLIQELFTEGMHGGKRTDHWPEFERNL